MKDIDEILKNPNLSEMERKYYENLKAMGWKKSPF